MPPHSIKPLIVETEPVVLAGLSISHYLSCRGVLPAHTSAGLDMLTFVAIHQPQPTKPHNYVPKIKKTTFWYKTTAISTCYLVSPAGGEAALLAWFFTMSLPKGNVCFHLSISEDKYVSGNKNKIHLHRVCTLTLILAEMVEQLPIQVTNPVI